MSPLDLIVYGGSFDPPHLGHLSCLEAVLEKNPRLSALVVPSYSPPDPNKGLKSVVADFKDRLAMTRMLFKSSTSAGYNLAQGV